MSWSTTSEAGGLLGSNEPLREMRDGCRERMMHAECRHLPAVDVQRFHFTLEKHDGESFNPDDILLGGIEAGDPPEAVEEYKTSTVVGGGYTYTAFHTEIGYVCLLQTANGYDWEMTMYSAGAGIYYPEITVDSDGYVYLAVTLMLGDTPYPAYNRTENPHDIGSFWDAGITYFPYETREGGPGSPSIDAGDASETALSFPSIQSGDTHYSLMTLYSADGGATWAGSYFSFEDFNGKYSVEYVSVKFCNTYVNVVCQVDNSGGGDVGHVCYFRLTFMYYLYHWWDYGDELRPHLATSGSRSLIVFETDAGSLTYNIACLYSVDSETFNFAYAMIDDLTDHRCPRAWLNGSTTYCVYRDAAESKAHYIEGDSGGSWSVPVQVSDGYSDIAFHYHVISTAYNVSQNRLYVVWSDRRNATNDIYFNADPPPNFTPTPTATATPSRTPTRTPTLTPSRTPSNTPTCTLTPTTSYTPYYVCYIDQQQNGSQQGFYVDDSFTRWQEFFPQRPEICEIKFCMMKLGVPPGDLIVSVVNDMGTVLWTETMPEDEVTTGWNIKEIPEGISVAISDSAYLQMDQTAEHDPQNGYFWSGNNASNYPGDSDISGSVPGYDYAFKVKTFLDATLTPTPLPTDSPSPTCTSTVTPSPTMTPTDAPTQSPTRTPTASPTRTGTVTPTITASATHSPTRTVTYTRTPTRSPTFSPSHTGTLTPTTTSSPTHSPSSTSTPSPTLTPTVSPTFSPSCTGTLTPTPTASKTHSPTTTATPSLTYTITPTITSSPTSTAIPTSTPSPTCTATSFPTPTSTGTAAPTLTPTFTLTATVTSTGSPTTAPTETPVLTPAPSHTPVLTPGTPSRTPEPAATASLGVILDMPQEFYSPGELFYLEARLINPGPAVHQTALFVILDVYGDLWFWPSWTRFPPELDFDWTPLNHGITPISIIEEFSWPDTGSDEAAGLVFWGAMLNDELNDLRGDMDRIEFGYGPKL